MSKKSNVHPDHYKVAGRERQGEDVNVGIEKAELTKPQKGHDRRRKRKIPG
jgi:hypothetical protein